MPGCQVHGGAEEGEWIRDVTTLYGTFLYVDDYKPGGVQVFRIMVYFTHQLGENCK
jgi:hypothetical protein